MDKDYCMKDAVIEETTDSLVISFNWESSKSDSTSSEANGSDDSEGECDGIGMLDLKNSLSDTTLPDFLVQQTCVMFV